MLELTTPELEKTLIRIALRKACGHRQEAAKLLGWGASPSIVQPPRFRNQRASHFFITDSILMVSCFR